jgi:hypothetical protein
MKVEFLIGDDLDEVSTEYLDVIPRKDEEIFFSEGIQKKHRCHSFRVGEVIYHLSGVPSVMVILYEGMDMKVS